MRLDRLRSGELLAGGGGILLLGSMFLPWFGKVSPFCTPFPGYSCGHDFDAWEAFGFTDVVLLLAALCGIAMALAGTNSKTDTQITSASLTVPVALLATLLVVYRLADPIGSKDLRVGIFIGLLGCAAVTYGSWRAVGNEQPSSVIRQSRSRRASRTRSRSSSDSPRPRSGTERRRRRRRPRPR
jgi:hypothetical protein